MTNDEIRLQFGELNASEMRLARAIVGWHEAKMKEALEERDLARERGYDSADRIIDLERELSDVCSVANAHNSKEACVVIRQLRVAADGLAEALAELVQCNESHNETISRIMGAPVGWKDAYLDKSRSALAAYQATKP